MERNFLQQKVISLIGVSALFSGLAWGGAAYAADRVVVIPMGSSSARVPVARTGQTTSYATGDDGALEKGAGMTSGRFVDNNNGTVTDRQTGLIWLKNGQCLNFYPGDTSASNHRSWLNALDAAKKLANGYCGLTDGSKAGDWRLPNKNELLSLQDYSQVGPALPAGCPLAPTTFNAVYWSSTTVGLTSKNDHAWAVDFAFGGTTITPKSSGNYIRCVHGGQ